MATRTYQQRRDGFATTLRADLSEPGDLTPSGSFAGGLVVSVSGPAQSVELVVERHSAITSGELPAPAGDIPASDSLEWKRVGPALQGDPSEIEPAAFDEPGVAHWRVRAVAVNGGSATVTVDGESA